eukprot:CAMPEP_0175058850 /NCGR_PEP_ID=MMETSP0052_2-20121109/12085_1 /TAXON_ID=51329 ORGANISM="Polytomella parva, Strain SAG 63-3" /NCGR_SAMPLE_ID=MMETSP0052_2 /ASSEMBLY_ACC=CAM_ASM_000194 /LENGTH=209 /DNA_ID=CAMNT_0016324293 /DNA_START=211 /DNA_END=841 /DNA_ORIENTATION=-
METETGRNEKKNSRESKRIKQSLKRESLTSSVRSDDSSEEENSGSGSDGLDKDENMYSELGKTRKFDMSMMIAEGVLEKPEDDEVMEKSGGMEDGSAEEGGEGGRDAEIRGERAERGKEGEPEMNAKGTKRMENPIITAMEESNYSSPSMKGRKEKKISAGPSISNFVTTDLRRTTLIRSSLRRLRNLRDNVMRSNCEKHVDAMEPASE